MSDQAGPTHDILFVCTGNSARSMIAERLASELSGGRLRGRSAGSHPKGAPHPGALEVLRRHGHDVSGLRSKSWDEFAEGAAASMDVIITVCDSAAGETCPVCPGAPLTAHWGVPDPAAVEGPPAAVAAAFELAYERLRRRIEAFLAEPAAGLSEAEARARLQAIGRLEDITSS